MPFCTCVRLVACEKCKALARKVELLYGFYISKSSTASHELHLKLTHSNIFLISYDVSYLEKKKPPDITSNFQGALPGFNTASSVWRLFYNHQQ